jgi:ABC-type Na+ efflux pump permease subunit
LLVGRPIGDIANQNFVKCTAQAVNIGSNIGCLSVAEERRLGTMEAHLGLPVSSRIQFAIKFLFVLVLGGFLSSTLLLAAESVATVLGAPAQIGIFEPGETPIVLFCTLLVVSLISFYASSLTRNLLQAMAVSVVLGLLTFRLCIIGPAMGEVWNLSLWRGLIFHCIAWPILIVVVLWLAYGNFRRLD